MFILWSMAASPPSLLHSVRVVARRTGLTPDLLRAWEKRYRVVEPMRTAGGQRNYTDADIERLRLLVRATAGGRQIGQVAHLGKAELEELTAGDVRLAPESAATEAVDPAVSQYLDGALTAAEHFDATALEAGLRTAALRLPSDQVLDSVFGPLLLAIGTRWQAGELPPANGHLATSIIRRVLTWMTDFPSVREDAPAIVVGTPALQMHDLGAMLAATAAAGSGWRVTFLGASLPALELARAARLAEADTVALSIVHPVDDARVASELRELRMILPAHTALLVGGAGAIAYANVLNEIGAERLDSIAALRNWLRERGAARQRQPTAGAG